MNIKSIQGNYEHLTMLERLSLADHAVSRNDESEIKAIIAASPRQSFTEPDYADLFVKITGMRLCNLILRPGYARKFDLLLQLNSDDNESISNSAKLAAYLYVRTTDAWKAISDELCLRPDHDKEIGRILFGVDLLTITDALLREQAFTEEEAKDYIKKQSGSDEMRTLADETKSMREMLGLSSK